MSKIQSIIKDIIKTDKKQTKSLSKINENYTVPVVYNDIPIEEKTFHKSNRIIKGKTNIKISKHTHNLGNFLYREMNIRMKKNNNVLDDNEITIPLSSMKKELKITTDSYEKIIKKSMEELKDGTIELEYYTDKQGRSFDYVVMSLISGFDKERLSNGEVIYNIEVSKKMIKFLNENSGGNYTLIPSKYTAILQGIKQIKLYEYCKQYVGFRGGKIPPLTLDKLNVIFQSNYQYLSKAKEQITKSLKNINTKTDITIAFIQTDNKKVIELLVVENERGTKDRQQLKKRKEMLEKSKGNGVYKFKNTEEENDIINNLLGENNEKYIELSKGFLNE
ncbi:replication initiation protein [Sulfurimonas xiamenensis]|uniref:Replication initiation protein n=1 Tax=Sulfurimonas xiamenensis TaxID=2590021 RepID=A0AAJ4A532_9BACT|nr:replication initiation protein [Sulfurimonas xiamenensis]QFR44055.1 replication initiation protein [Sulfurimonas xiamenensis]